MIILLIIIINLLSTWILALKFVEEDLMLDNISSKYSIARKITFIGFFVMCAIGVIFLISLFIYYGIKLITHKIT